MQDLKPFLKSSPDNGVFGSFKNPANGDRIPPAFDVGDFRKSRLWTSIWSRPFVDIFSDLSKIYEEPIYLLITPLGLMKPFSLRIYWPLLRFTKVFFFKM